MAVEEVAYPELTWGADRRPCEHGAIVRVLATNLCGSDEHVYRGLTGAEPGRTMGHELTGEVVEVGRAVERVRIGDLVSVPFNVACGACSQCRRGWPNCCAHLPTDFGYVERGGLLGAQAAYVMRPHADYNFLRIPEGEVARRHLLDLAMLSDILPTGYHGCVQSGVEPGSSVYIAGAGPVGVAAAVSARLLGAAWVVLGDPNGERVGRVRELGFLALDGEEVGRPAEALAELIGHPQVDSAIDCVGFVAQSPRGAPPLVDTLVEVTRPGGRVAIIGYHPPLAPGASGPSRVRVDLAAAWAKSIAISTGNCPVGRYNRLLRDAILADRVAIAAAVNATVVQLSAAPAAYADFAHGVPRKYIFAPHGPLS